MDTLKMSLTVPHVERSGRGCPREHVPAYYNHVVANGSFRKLNGQLCCPNMCFGNPPGLDIKDR